jgi:hypothetical protein
LGIGFFIDAVHHYYNFLGNVAVRVRHGIFFNILGEVASTARIQFVVKA